MSDEKIVDAAAEPQAVAEVHPEPAAPAPTAPKQDEAVEPAGVSLRFYAESKKLQPWQVAATLPHVRARAAELKLEPLHDETGRVLPVNELDAIVERALNGRV
jgi:hypothetical protein